MSERELAEWAIATGGNVDVYISTPPFYQRIAIASELPQGRFIITTMMVNCDKVPGKDLSPLASAQDVGRLFLENSLLADKTSPDLTPLRQMPKLRTLTARDLDAAAVGTVASLEDLDTLYTKNLPEGSLEKIAKLKQLVEFESNSIHGPGIASFKSCKQLRKILNAGNPDVSDDDIRALAAALPDLETLRIGGTTALTNACIPSLLMLKSLKYLELHSNELDDSLIESLAKLPRLDTLNLNSTKIVGSNFEVLRKFDTLRELYLDGCSVTDEALDVLVQIKGLTKLQLRRTKVTDAGIAKFKAARPGFNVSK
jgi:Leucine-rich repeat (LRR) protein